jgi:hypothetical protein
LLVTPLAPVGFASTNRSQLAQTRSKSAEQKQQTPAKTNPATTKQTQPTVAPAAIAATDITATKTDAIVGDSLGDGKAQAGDTIRYTITVRNNSATDTANGVTINDTIDPNTTIVGGSLHAQPVARTDSYTTVSNTLLEVGVTPSGAPAVGVTGSVLDNDTQPNGAGGTDAFEYVSNTNPTNGTLTFNSNGTFSYLPNVGYVGADSFTYTVRNNGDNTLTDTATVNLTVSPATATAGSDIWYVDNSYTGGASDGRSTRPFTSLANVNGAGGSGDSDAAGDIIYLATGNATYTTGLILENSQLFIGNGVALSVTLGGTPTTLRAAGTRPTLSNSSGNIITLAQNNTVSGLNTGATAAGSAAIAGNTFGTATVGNLAIGSGADRALNLATGTLAITLDSSTSSGANTGMNLTNTGGTLTVTGATSMSNGTGLNIAGAAFPTVNFNGGLSITSTAGAGIVAAGGNINIAGTTNTIGSTGGPALDLTNVNLGSGATFSTVSSSGSGTNGIKFNNVTGNFVANGGSIGTATGTDVDITAGGGDFTYAGSITNAAGRSISVINRTGGTATFSGSINDTGTGMLLKDNTPTSGTSTFNFSNTTKTFNTGANAAITLDNNDNATINFTNGNLSVTTTGGIGIDAKNGASAINITGTGNIISSGTGTALSVVSSNIGSSGLTFQSISSSGAPSGIVLNATGATASNGGLTVTGNSSGICGGSVTVNAVGTPATITAPNTADCTGGLIQNSTGDGISLTNVKTISLTRMRVVNSGNLAGGDFDHGISVSGATGVTLDRINVSDNTGLSSENGVDIRNSSGTVTVSNSTIGTSPEHCLVVDNFNVNMTAFNLTNSVLRDTATDINTTGTGGDGLLLQMRGNSVLTNAAIANSVFTNLAATGIQALTADTARIGSASNGAITAPAASNSVTIQNNTFTSNNIALDISQAQQSSEAFQVLSNTLQTHRSHAINVFSATGADTGGTHFHVGKIDGNHIGIQGTKDSGSRIGSAIRAVIQGRTTQGSITISNNTLRETVNADIITLFGQEGSATAGTTGSARFNVMNNVMPTPSGSTQALCGPANTPCAANGIFVLADEAFPVCVNITGNNIYDVSTMNGTAGVYLAERVGPPTGAQLTVQGSGASTTFIASNNTIAGINKVIDEGGNTTTVASCGSFPTLPDYVDINAIRVSENVNTQSAPAPAVSEVAPAAANAQPTFFIGSQQKLASTAKANSAAQKTATTDADAAQSKTPEVQPMVGGNAFPVSLGSLAPGDSVVLTFTVQVASTLPQNVTQISNQGQITSSSFGGTVLTDDPDAAGTNNPTVTPVLGLPTISINNASVAEPKSGSAPMPFTVTLDHAYGSPVSVNFSTADGTATAGTDYVSTSGTVNFNAAQLVQTIDVPVLSDGDASETDETFTVTLNTPTNGILSGTPTATGTITVANPAGTVLISEVRTSGPSGANDEFVELYNNTDATIDISGWALVKSGASCTDTPVVVATIPAAKTIPARGHYLIAGSAYGLGSQATPDQTLLVSNDIEDDRNLGLFNTSNLANLSTATRRDAVGFGLNTLGNCALLREGSNLPAALGSTSQYSFARNLITGLPRDTNDATADFIVVSTTPATIVGNNATPVLGAPGPEATTSPIQRNAVVKSSLIDPTLPATAPPNRVRSSFGANPTNAAFGTLSIQRRFKNTLVGANVTRLRFRIVDLTTINNRTAGQSDLRVLSSNGVVRDSAGNQVGATINGLTLEGPPQPNGGGLNSTLTVVLPGGGLAPGATIDVQFLLGVQEQGAFSFFINTEALPGTGTIPNEATGATKGATGGKQADANAGGAAKPDKE